MPLIVEEHMEERDHEFYCEYVVSKEYLKTMGALEKGNNCQELLPYS